MKPEIKPIDILRDKKEFIKLPWQLYKDDPNWVPPLLQDMKNTFNPKKNALLTLGPYQYFLAYHGQKPVGRIGVGIDEHLNTHKGFKGSYLTLFESIQDYDVAQALFDSALNWAKQHGAEFITGPQSPSNGDDYRGLLIMGFDSPPALLNSYNPQYYQEFFERYGFTKYFDRNSYFVDIENSTVPENFQKGVEYAKKRYGFTVEQLDMKSFNESVEAIVQIATTAWPDEWPDMVPPTPEEVRAEVSKLKSLIQPELIYIARDKNNKPIGFEVTLPNYNEILKKINGRLFPFGWLKFLIGKNKISTIRSFILFTVPEYHRKGVSGAMYLEGFKSAKELGYKWCDGSSIHDFNIKMNQDVVGVGGKLYKVFRIYRKDL